MCHVSIALRRDMAAAELIAMCCVEARRDDHQVGIKLLGNGHDNLLERSQVLPIPHPLRMPADVDVLPGTCTLADVCDTAIRLVALRLTRVEHAVLVDVQGDV